MKGEPLRALYLDDSIEVGCDEAGRGCLAGPVVAAAVILPPDYFNKDINDSKQLSEKKRFMLRDVILKEAISYSIGVVTNTEIDKINILQSSIKAMHLALHEIEKPFTHIIVDGNRFKPYNNIPFTCIVKGDSKFFSIAAASILAKTYRDELMVELAQEYPHYGWEINKGYPTLVHRAAIEKYGITPYHRKSFRLLNDQYTIDFGS